MATVTTGLVQGGYVLGGDHALLVITGNSYSGNSGSNNVIEESQWGTTVTNNTQTDDNSNTADSGTWDVSINTTSDSTDGFITRDTTYQYRAAAYFTRYNTTYFGTTQSVKTPATPMSIGTPSSSSVLATTATIQCTYIPYCHESTWSAQLYYKKTSDTLWTAAGTPGSGTNDYTQKTESENLTGLTPNTQYQYYLQVTRNSSTDQSITSSTQTFTTTLANPSVTTKAASSMSATSASLGATVNAGNFYTTGVDLKFRYSTTSPPDSGTLVTYTPAITGSTDADYYKQITGLTQGSTYYARAFLFWPTGFTTSSTSDAIVSFIPYGPPAADFTATPLSGTQPLSVQFQDLSSTATGWEYGFVTVAGGPAPANVASQSPLVNFNNVGTYTVYQTATNTAASVSTSKASLITVLSGAPVASFTANTTTGVRPLTVGFTDLSTNTPTSWNWFIGDTTVIGEQNPSHVFTSSGTYSVELDIANAYGTSISIRTNYIHVTPIPVSGATFTGAPLYGAAPLAVTFFGTASTGDISYNTSGSPLIAWNFGDSSTASQTQTPSHTYTSTGTYTVVMTVTGQANTATVTRSNYITVALDQTYKAFLDDLRRTLLLNTDSTTVCADFVEFGGTSTVLKYAYDRICRLQLEAGPLRKVSTNFAGAGGVLNLPSDFIEARAVYVNGNRLLPVDSKMADLYKQDWQISTGDYLGWYIEPADNLILNLVPPVSPDTFELYYVYAPPVPTVPGDCSTAFDTFPLPYVFWWIIKYGVLADLLYNEGEMYDIERAKLCEAMFEQGVEFVKLALNGD